MKNSKSVQILLKNYPTNALMITIILNNNCLLTYNSNKFIIKMDEYRLTQPTTHNNPDHTLTPTNNNSSWTDHRIQEIKKKYDSTIKKILYPQHNPRIKTDYQDKENIKMPTKNQYQQSNIQKYQLPLSSSNISKPTRTPSQNTNNHQPSEISRYATAKSLNIKNRLEQNNSPFQKSTMNLLKQPIPLSKPYEHASIRLMNEYNTFTRHRDPSYKLNRREVYDSRMENIDKINSKIKKILDCINNCQQESRVIPQNQDYSPSVSRSFLGKSLLSKGTKNDTYQNELEQTKIISKKQFYYPNQTKGSDQLGIQQYERFACSRNTQMNQTNSFQQYLTNYKERLKEQQQQLFLKNSVKKEIVRSSSCFSRPRRQDLSTDSFNEEKIEDIDKQITRFHKKIEELEDQKRKMNIKFTPFHYEPSPIKKQTKCTPESFKKVKLFDNPQDQSYSPLSTSNKFNSTYKQISQFSSKAQPETLHKVNQDLSPTRNKTTLAEVTPSHKKSFAYELQDIKQSIISEQNSEPTSKPYDNQELRKKIEQRMEQRRKLLQSLSINDNSTQRSSIQQFIQTLAKQVSLDEILRNSKNWFVESHTPSKANLLKQQLLQKGAELTLNEIQQEFNSINEIENDPFFSFREQKFTIHSVADNYLQSKLFWQTQLLKQWNFNTLVSRNSFFSKFLSKKQIAVEDLVRLLNTETGNFYRNRDLHLIFERIKAELNCPDQPTITIDQFKTVLGK